MSDEYLFSVDLPEEWATARLVDQCVYAPRGDNDAPVMHLAALVLADGSSIFVLMYPGGERSARVSPHTDWALEERLGGNPPIEEHRAIVDDAWRGWLDALVGIGRFTGKLMQELDELDDEDEDEDEQTNGGDA